MDRWVQTVAREKGVALPLALFALVMLSGLLLAFLSMAGMEPEIAANLNDVTRARYVAEAGIEWGYDQLVLNWATRNTLLTTNGGTLATNMTLPGLPGADGTFAVTVRNDNLAGDQALTGLPVCPNGDPLCSPDGGGAGNDTNSAVILTATGTFRGTTRQIRVVVTHLDISIPGGLDLPGVGSNTRFSGNSFIISGNDTNLDGSAGAGTPGCPQSVYGIGVADAATETLVQNSLSNQQKDNVVGKPTLPPLPGEVLGQGNNTITPDASLTPAAIQRFVDKIKPYADISLTSSGSNHLKYQNLGSTCATDLKDPSCWGTIADPATGVAGNPKIVYIEGTVDPAQSFYALELSGTSAGAGILIIKDGDLKITGNFRWEGYIIITGAYTGLYYGGGGDQTIYGGIIVNETVNVNSEVEVDAAGNAKLLYSCQAIDNVRKSRKTYHSQSWREL